MIQVGVAIQKNLHVLDFETELGHVSLNLGRGFGKTAVENDVPLRCRDQERADFRSRQRSKDFRLFETAAPVGSFRDSADRPGRG